MKGKESVKAIVVGAAGKMGARIIHIIKETPGIELFRAVERPDHPLIGKEIGEIVGLGKMGVPLEGALTKAGGDVVTAHLKPLLSRTISVSSFRSDGSPLG